MIEVACNNQHPSFAMDYNQLAKAVRQVLEKSGYTCGSLSLAIVDDASMHALNRRHLQHDYTTDVLSFLLESEDDYLEGEIILCADYAARGAAAYGWSAEEELLLYVVHGALHLVGYDDHTAEDRAEMRRLEAEHLQLLGIIPRWQADEI